MIKTCNSCLTEKPISEFSKKKSNRDGYHLSCKLCTRIVVRRSYEKNKQYYIDKAARHKTEITQLLRKIKEKTPCKDCNIKYAYYVMDFDHLRDKEFCIANFQKGKKKILKETEKCEVVCSNCHRIRTHNRRTLT